MHMTQVPVPVVESHVEPEHVCEALNINLLTLALDLPIQVVSCVARHILVPMVSRHQMQGLLASVCVSCTYLLYPLPSIHRDDPVYLIAFLQPVVKHRTTDI